MIDDSIEEKYKFLILHMLKQFRRKFVVKRESEDDYIQEGYLALLRAASKYDENDESHAKFSSYACMCIFHAMTDYHAKDRTITGQSYLFRKKNWENDISAKVRKQGRKICKMYHGNIEKACLPIVLNVEKSVSDKVQAQEITSNLNWHDKQLITNVFFRRETCRKIAKREGRSFQAVGAHVRRIIRRLANECSPKHNNGEIPITKVNKKTPNLCESGAGQDKRIQKGRI